MQRSRQRPSPGALLGVAALVVAMGGGAYAATKIQTSDIANSAVTTKKIAKGAVNGERLASNSVKKNKIKDEAIASDKIAGAAVTEAKISEAAVAADKLADDAVTETKLADGSVSSAKLQHPTYWARVATGIPPSLEGANGATEALRITPGNYRVEFAADISDCSYQVTSNDVNDNLIGAAEVDVTDEQRVFVSLRATAGTRTDGDFNLAVHC